jgi:hypothetical protein
MLQACPTVGARAYARNRCTVHLHGLAPSAEDVAGKPRERVQLSRPDRSPLGPLGCHRQWCTDEEDGSMNSGAGRDAKVGAEDPAIWEQRSRLTPRPCSLPC